MMSRIRQNLETRNAERLVILAAFLFLAVPFLAAENPSSPIQLTVDAREAHRGIVHAELVIPAQPGPFTLLYPKWIPGTHRPEGPIADLVGVKINAGGRDIAWERDPLDMYAFRFQVPPGSQTITVTLDHLAPAASPHLTILNWNQVLLYPQGHSAGELTYAASLRLPAGWKLGTALTVLRESPNLVEFQPVSLTTLVDSPVIAGAYFRTVPLSEGSGPPHYMDIAADSPAVLEVPPEVISQYKQLVAEAGALFGARHYARYHFLVTLSEHARDTLEHHQSSVNSLPEQGFNEEARRKVEGDLLPHEYTHSWNGKYRRPAGLITADFNQAAETDLLWVYEGLTQYLGKVLAARSGLWTGKDFREVLADTAAYLDHRPGRTWRSLADTAVASQILRTVPPAWSSWRRGQDYYDESVLIWLEADAILRQKSQGRYSLDDFSRRFYGGQSGPPAVVPYSFQDVVATLAELVPHDWRGFLTERLNSTSPRAPLGGIEASGWRLVYRDTPSDFTKASEETTKRTDLRFSIGLTLNEENVVRDVIPGGPAARAGMSPGIKLTAVNGRRFSPALFRQAIQAAKGTSDAIELIAEDREFYKTYRVDYHDGERYPHLERNASRPDLLEEIIKPRTPVISKSQ